jgi:hypothetical protein
MPGKVFTAGEILTAADTNEFLVNNGYQFREAVYFTSSGTFSKADYSWLRAIRVKCQGAGGGGGGAATTGSSQIAVGGSGAGGAYAESFITDIAGLDASVTVTRGSGGAGGAAGNNNASNGGSSSFGSLVSAGGGDGGGGSSAGAVNSIPGNREGSTTGTGDLVIPGGPNHVKGQVRTDFLVPSGSGGSFLGAGLNTFLAASEGVTGLLYGGGGTGGANTASQATARAGGAGGDGIVIVELYA